MRTVELDCRGLNCPMPIVRLSRAMKELASGDVVHVQASDPSFRADLEAWVRQTGQTLVSFETHDGTQRAVVQKP